MYYTKKYESPIGTLQLVADDNNLIGIYYNHQTIKTKESIKENTNHPILKQTSHWLDRYFNDEQPDINTLPLHFEGTDFQKQVWRILLEIPYGTLHTYGDIAKKVAKLRNLDTMSSQAVGGAVGSNPISIVVPCHRVVGKNGNLTGYGGGLDKKTQLLQLEHVDIDKLHFPK